MSTILNVDNVFFFLSLSVKKKKNSERKLLEIGLGNNFLYMTSEALAVKAKINKRNYLKLKCLSAAKDSQQHERQSTK